MLPTPCEVGVPNETVGASIWDETLMIPSGKEHDTGKKLSKWRAAVKATSYYNTRVYR